MELTLVKTLNCRGDRAMISPRTPALIGPRRHRVRAQRRVHFSYTFFYSGFKFSQRRSLISLLFLK